MVVGVSSVAYYDYGAVQSGVGEAAIGDDSIADNYIILHVGI